MIAESFCGLLLGGGHDTEGRAGIDDGVQVIHRDLECVLELDDHRGKIHGFQCALTCWDFLDALHTRKSSPRMMKSHT